MKKSRPDCAGWLTDGSARCTMEEEILKTDFMNLTAENLASEHLCCIIRNILSLSLHFCL